MQFERNIDIIRQMQSGIIYHNIRSARTGQKDSAYTSGVNPNPTNGLAAGYIWVRDGEDGDRGQTVAIIVGVRSDIADIPILIGERATDGTLCAIGPDINPKTIAQYGGSLPATGVPNTPTEWQRQPVDSIYVSPGRVRPSILNPDTLYVYIEPFMHNGSWYGGIEYDVGSANVPASANEARWVIVTLNTSNTGATKTGTTITIANIDQMQAINSTYGLNSITIPSGDVPVGALTLAYGQTAIKDSRFVDPRYWLAARGTLLAEASSTLTLSTDAATAGSGSYFIIAAQTGTTDDLATLTVAGPPRIVVIQADAGDTITVKNGTGNINLNGAADFELTGNKTLALFWDGTNLADMGAGGASGANTALSNLASVAINTSLISDTDSTDNLGSTSVYWANGYIDTVYLTEQAAPSTPATDKGVIYPKTDGKLYFKNDGGTEYDLTAGSGSGISSETAVYASLTTGSAGDIKFPSDGFHVFRSTGSALAPWGPIFPMSLPSFSGSWTNQGSATVTTEKGSVVLDTPGVAAGSNNLRVYTKTAPSTPYTITVGFIPFFQTVTQVAGSVGCGLVFRQSSDGKLATLEFEFVNAVASTSIYGFVTSRKWTNATTFSGTYVQNFLSPAVPSMGVIWMRIADNATNRICSLSTDGQTWKVLHSVTRTDFLTADQIGFVLRADGATTFETTMRIISYQES